MKYLSEFRDARKIREVLDKLRATITRPWVIMEVCGGQTHNILRFGVDRVISPVELVHGPGCPVCVTPPHIIDLAIELALKPNVILTSFGDMLRVPGSELDLLSAKAQGGDVRTVYSPIDAVKLAQENPSKEVVFFAVGFETTAPSVAMAVKLAEKLNLKNFSILVSHFLVPPALKAIFSNPETKIQGLLAPGHVCTVTGYEEYEEIAQEYKIPIVVTGFEPLDLVQGIYMCVEMLERGEVGVRNQYTRSATREGNLKAKELMWEVFEVVDREWRGLGLIPKSGMKLRESYKRFDALEKLGLKPKKAKENEVCISGLILQGIKKPTDCPAFGKECTPTHPLGAPMVSSEGACAAYYKYHR